MKEYKNPLLSPLEEKRPEQRKKEEEKIKSEHKIELIYQCVTKSQLEALLEEGIKDIAVDVFSRDRDAIKIKDLTELKEKHKVNIYLKVPNIVKMNLIK